MGTHIVVVGHEGYFLNIWDSWVHVLLMCSFYSFIKIYLDVLKCWTVINVEFILRFTHTSFLAYRVCCLQPGAPLFGVGVRPAGEDQQG